MFSDPSPSFGCGTVCSFFHWSHCESSHGFQRKYSIQTTFPMRVLCLTRWFLNSCNPGSLWHSHMTFHYLRIWLLPDKPISVWMFILRAHHSVWTEWETASSYNTLTWSVILLAEMGLLAHASEGWRAAHHRAAGCAHAVTCWGSECPLHCTRATPHELQLGHGQRWRWEVWRSICWCPALDLLFPKKCRGRLNGTKVAAL